ncbi:MAG: hypothetical protein AAF389_05225 [Gemmatimonadota bacterium]
MMWLEPAGPRPLPAVEQLFEVGDSVAAGLGMTSPSYCRELPYQRCWTRGHLSLDVSESLRGDLIVGVAEFLETDFSAAGDSLLRATEAAFSGLEGVTVQQAHPRWQSGDPVSSRYQYPDVPPISPGRLSLSTGSLNALGLDEATPFAEMHPIEVRPVVDRVAEAWAHESDRDPKCLRFFDSGAVVLVAMPESCGADARSGSIAIAGLDAKEGTWLGTIVSSREPAFELDPVRRPSR